MFSVDFFHDTLESYLDYEGAKAGTFNFNDKKNNAPLLFLSTLAFKKKLLTIVNFFQVAQKFYSLLVLKKYQVLKLQQSETYGSILISKGNQFETEAI